MIPLTVKEVAESCGGRIDGADPDALVTTVVIDSRRASPGALFVALPGERSDGHSFVDDARAAGAVAALVTDGSDARGPQVRVPDPLAALISLAEAVRARLRARVIAITGSSGKTCTKDMTAAAVAVERRTVSSPASYNNEIGVPLTVLSASEDTAVLVVEVGSRGAGHITALAPAIRPDVAVVTNVGSAHIGLFGSLERTARAKAELLEALGPDGVAVLNADDPLVLAMAERARGTVVTFGRRPGADIRADGVVLDADVRASFGLVAGEARAPVVLRIPGEHMIGNALAAAGAARAVGVGIGAIARGLGAAEVPAWRMEVRDSSGRRILNDAYNANPESMAAALRTLVTMARGRPTWAVLGQMAELGEHAAGAHDAIGRLAVRLGVGHLVTVGEDARAIHEAARLEGMSGDEARFARDAANAIALVRASVEPDAVVLVKASRVVGLERVARALLEGDA